MFLLDNKPDSLAIYADWLEDNDQLALATEIRQQEPISHFWEEAPTTGVGGAESVYFCNGDRVGCVGYFDSVGCFWLLDVHQVGFEGIDEEVLL